MGLLDMLQGFSDNPAAQQGLLAAGLGMLAGNTGGVSTGQALGRGGLLGLQAYGGAQEAAQKAEQMKQQMALQDTETQMKQQQMAILQRDANNKSAMDNYLLTGQPPSVSAAIGATPPAPPAPSMGGVGGAPGGTSAAGAPGGPGSATTAALAGGGMAPSGAPMPPPMAPQAAPADASAGGTPDGGPLANMSPGKRAAIMADRAYNDGKGIANLLNPNIEITPSGVVFDKTSGKVISTVPVVDMPTGRGSQLGMGPGGQFQVAPVAGGDTLAANRARTDQQIKSEGAYREVEGPGGVKRLVTEAEIRANPALGVTQRSPEVSQALQLGNTDFMTRSYTPTLTAGDAATNDKADIQAMRSIPATTGWGAENAGKAASILGALGFKDPEKFAGDQQTFNNVALSKLNQNLAAQKGPQTEGDAVRAARTFASLGNTPQANKFILDYAEAQANLKQRKASYYAEMLPEAQKTGDLGRIEREWRKIQGSIWNDPLMSSYAQQQGGK